MNSTHLYNFTFVGRKEEKNKFNHFINNRDSSNILLIRGNHGVGKSYLVEESIKKSNITNYVYHEIQKETENSNCLLSIVDLLQKKFGTSFVDYVYKNYNRIFDITLKSLLSIFKVQKSPLYEIVNFAFDTKKTLLRKNSKEQDGLTKVIIDYINYSKDKNGFFLFVIDNFHICDKKSVPILIDIMLHYISDPKVAFILISTGDGNELPQTIYENIPLTIIKVEPFDHENYFLSILTGIFNIDNTINTNINAIFSLCKGYPEELKSFIRNLFHNNGIEFYKEDRPSIDVQVLKDQLNNTNKDDIKCNFINQSDYSAGAKLILKIIIHFKQLLTSDIILKIAMYMITQEKMLHFLNTERLDECLYKLIDEQLLTVVEKGGFQYIKVKNDAVYNSLEKHFSDDSLQCLNCKYFFEYINSNEKEIQEILSQEDISALKAYFSFKSKYMNWRLINFEFGKYKYELKQFYDAQIIFNRLSDITKQFDLESVLIIVNCFFDCGDYNKAKELLLKYDKNEIQDYYFDYNLIYAKIENIIMCKEHSLRILDNLIMSNLLSQEQYITVLILQQQILTNCNKVKESKEIFDKVITCLEDKDTAINYKDFYSILKSSIEYYSGKNAQKYLNIAYNNATENNNMLEIGYIKTNMGFNYFWNFEFENAEKSFQESIDVLTPIKIHEISYPLNNLAVCKMIGGEIDDAILLLTKALRWNESKYAEYMIYTQLMLCYAINQEFNLCKDFASKLSNIISSNSIIDTSIRMKINYNLSFAHEKMGEDITATTFAEKALAIALQNDPKFLPYTWMPDYMAEVNNKVVSKMRSNTHFLNNRFDPWLIMFSHD